MYTGTVSLSRMVQVHLPTYNIEIERLIFIKDIVNLALARCSENLMSNPIPLIPRMRISCIITNRNMLIYNLENIFGHAFNAVKVNLLEESDLSEPNVLFGRRLKRISNLRDSCQSHIREQLGIIGIYENEILTSEFEIHVGFHRELEVKIIKILKIATNILIMEYLHTELRNLATVLQREPLAEDQAKIAGLTLILYRAIFSHTTCLMPEKVMNSHYIARGVRLPSEKESPRS